MGVAYQGLLRHLEEDVLDVGALHGRHLIEGEFLRLGVLLALLGLNEPVSLLVELVAQHHEGEARLARWSTVVHEAFAPAVQILERDGVRDIVNQTAAVGAAVKGVPKRLELLLASCVPNLQRHHVVVNDELLLAEVGANRWLGVLVYFTIQVLLQEGSLTDARVAEDHNLKEVFLSGGGRHFK